MSAGKSIWKFSRPLAQLDTYVEFDVPAGARVLSAVNQYECLAVYCLVDVASKLVKRRFYVCGTGHPYDINTPTHSFVGTVVFAGGDLVFHIFDHGE